MFQIRVLVKKLLCLDCEEKHGKADATFDRGSERSVYDPKSLVCPRCGGVNTLPEIDLEITDLTRKRPRRGDVGTYFPHSSLTISRQAAGQFFEERGSPSGGPSCAGRGGLRATLRSARPERG